MKDEKKMAIAKLLYTRNYSDENEISDMLDISVQQLARWSLKGEWETLRKAMLSTKEEHLRMCHSQLSKLNLSIVQGNGFPNDKEALTQKRLAASIEHLETDTSISHTVEVAKEFCDWLRNDDMDFGKTVMVHFDIFIKQKLKKAGIKVQNSTPDYHNFPMKKKPDIDPNSI